MARIAVRSYLNSFLRSRKEPTIKSDVVFIVGKGKGSEGVPVLMPTVMKLLTEEFKLEAVVDPLNAGRIRVSKNAIDNFVKTRRWKL
jgi:DNA-nicking Smr family endonuclease